MTHYLHSRRSEGKIGNMHLLHSITSSAYFFLLPEDNVLLSVGTIHHISGE
jgi:hypothetical protein